jgi:hypothetical protein
LRRDNNPCALLDGGGQRPAVHNITIKLACCPSTARIGKMVDSTF